MNGATDKPEQRPTHSRKKRNTRNNEYKFIQINMILQSFQTCVRQQFEKVINKKFGVAICETFSSSQGDTVSFYWATRTHLACIQFKFCKQSDFENKISFGNMSSVCRLSSFHAMYWCIHSGVLWHEFEAMNFLLGCCCRRTAFTVRSGA